MPAAKSLDADRVAALYTQPLAEFTEARNALAKELRKAGDEEGAAAVKKLRKPSVSAWALDRAARSEPDAVNELLGAAKKLEHAQAEALEGGGAKALRDAMGRQARAIEALVDAAGAELADAKRSSAAMLDRARETLRAAATDPEVREALAEGRLAEDHKATGFGALAPAPADSGKRAGRAKTNKPSAAQRKRAAARVKKAEGAVKTAGKRLEGARTGLEGAERALEAAREKLSAAEREHTQAENEARGARAEIDALES